MEQLTLTEVQIRFAAWRKKRQRREPIPDELWDAAVKLTEKYPVYKISKVLSLCNTTLKKRAKAVQVVESVPPAGTPEFIPVDFSAATPTECCIEMEHHNGNKLRMHFKGKAELDLQFLAESSWNSNS